MTSQINESTASQLFDTEVTLRVQNEMRLQNTIEERHGTTGDATNVPLSDIVEMSQGNFAPTNIPVTQVNETNNVVVPFDFRLKTSIGGGEKTLFAYNKIVDHAKLHARAAGRANDLIKINAILQSASYGSLYTVPVTVGTNTGMNSDKIADALSYLESQGVDVSNMNDCSMWCPALLKKSMMADEKIVNIFYNNNKPLTNNAIKNYLDVDIRFLGENGVNKIPRTGAGTSMSPYQYLVPLVWSESIVQIFNRDIQTSITWVPQEDRWDLLTVFTSGALLIQPNTVALITANTPFVSN